MPKFRRLVPMLQTLDMERTVAWYEAVLGFRRGGQQVQGWCSLERDLECAPFGGQRHAAVLTRRWAC